MIDYLWWSFSTPIFQAQNYELKKKSLCWIWNWQVTLGLVKTLAYNDYSNFIFQCIFAFMKHAYAIHNIYP